MKPITVREFCGIVKGDLLAGSPEAVVSGVTTDSRWVSPSSAFFALRGRRTDGHRHVEEAFRSGAAAAVVARESASSPPQPAAGNVVSVDDPLAALQRLGGWWRGAFGGRVVALTGSRGKTLVKDALLRCLTPRFAVAGNPGSLNSQLGVPLSLLRVPAGAEYAVLEAGVSLPGEMDRHEAMLRPDFGIVTHMGLAHVASFGTRRRIAEEKLRLFRAVGANGWVLAPAQWDAPEELLRALPCRVVRFGGPSDEVPWVEDRVPSARGLTLTVRFPDGQAESIPVRAPSLEVAEDIEAALAAAWLLGVGASPLAAALAGYEPPHTRLEMWRTLGGVTLINDPGSSDPLSIQAALSTLAQVGAEAPRRVFALGCARELLALGEPERGRLGRMVGLHPVDLLVLPGGAEFDNIASSFEAAAPDGVVRRGAGPADLGREWQRGLGPGDVVLYQGPREAGIDRLAAEVGEAIAPNRFLVDLHAVAENVSRFRRLAGPGARIVGMVKALSYGSDLLRLSLELQNLGLDALGVSSPDEGILLRRAGIGLPILVFFCSEYEADKVVEHGLTPIVYSFALLEPLAAAARARDRTLDVHLKVDTGMGRLGVMPDQAVALARAAVATGVLRVTGVATHFACAEDPAQDDFTRGQIRNFERAAADLGAAGFTGLVRHAAATAGAVRFPESRLDMVRIGLGLYGIYPGPAVAQEIELDLAVAVVSRLSEIRVLSAGQGVGYGQTFRAPRDGFRLGFLPNGYADALPWQLANRGQVMIHGQRAPLVGRISMDSAAVDLTGVEAAEVGSEVLIYGSRHGYTVRPEEVAEAAGTIPYELLTRLGPRVQRLFLGR